MGRRKEGRSQLSRVHSHLFDPPLIHCLLTGRSIKRNIVCKGLKSVKLSFIAV